MIIINLNAPPKAGKDTICQGLIGAINHPGYEVYHMEFKELLFDVAIRAAGVSEALWYALYDRRYKEIPTPYLIVDGVSVSPREWMIHCSETIMKPIFGNDVFGKAFAEKLRRLEEATAPSGRELVIVVSDGGFIEESIPVVSKVGPQNYLLTRIHRLKEDGTEYDFTGDSRRYLFANEFPEDLRPHEADIYNDEGDVDGTVSKILSFLEAKIDVK